MVASRHVIIVAELGTTRPKYKQYSLHNIVSITIYIYFDTLTIYIDKKGELHAFISHR